MPRIEKVKEVPEVPLKSITTALRESRRRSIGLSKQLRKLYQPLFKSYREEIQGRFYSMDYGKERGTDRPVWVPAIARQQETSKELSESFNEMLDAADKEAGAIMSDELTEELEESYDHTLWALYQQGVDVSDLPSLGDFDAKKALLISAGVAGLSYLDRLKEANKINSSRFLKWMRATINGGQPLAETLSGFDIIMHSHLTRVTRLGENENHRSLALGTDLAHERLSNQLMGSVWITNGPKPCKLCIGRNLEITRDLPVEHSHPGCRCIKVPIALDYRGRPVNYVEFLQSIGRR